MKHRGMTIASLVFMTSACASQATTTAVETASARFYAQVSAGDYQAIYTESAPQFRTMTPQVWAGFMTRIILKMGACKAPVKNNAIWGETVSTNGVFIVQGYSRECARGVLQEKLTFIVNGDKANLVGYNANNPLLMT